MPVTKGEQCECCNAVVIGNQRCQDCAGLSERDLNCRLTQGINIVNCPTHGSLEVVGRPFGMARLVKARNGRMVRSGATDWKWGCHVCGALNGTRAEVTNTKLVERRRPQDSLAETLGRYDSWLESGEPRLPYVDAWIEERRLECAALPWGGVLT